ncbi:MAG: multicopper oxidase domain-containing protein [Gammaproteobacteria bacterium]|nr:multicopper oxidase domain-containing protein [Gammaproteobacteria bacterium]
MAALSIHGNSSTAARTRRPTALLTVTLALACTLASALTWADAREFEMTIEDTRMTLVDKQDFHTFAFNGQVPGPLIHVKEGDDITVKVMNLTSLPHTIHWHGLLQRGTWQNDGVPGVTQEAIKPGEDYTYHFVAAPSGTMWYHCHVNVNEHVAMRGMWGPLIIDPREPKPIEKAVTRDFILMLADWDDKWANKPGYGGVPGDVFNYFTINGKAYPDTQPLRVKKGDVLRLRLIGAGELIHSIHIHGHVFKVAFKDGHALPAPYEADTILVGPGERYDLIFEADNPGLWMVHDHVDSHTVNGEKPMGGIMTVIQYAEIDTTNSVYEWKNKPVQPDFFYEESLKAPYGLHTPALFKGTAIQ